MTKDKKTAIAGALGDFSLVLASFSALTYELGAIADVLPPEIKKWTAIGSIVAAALSKTTQRVIEIFTK